MSNEVGVTRSSLHVAPPLDERSTQTSVSSGMSDVLSLRKS